MEEEKKVERKKKRFAARLKSSKGIICTDIPGPNIVLCNVGQATGLDKEAIHTFVNNYCSDILPPKYIAEKGESHSFLVFKSTEKASSFYNHCNGKPLDENCTPLYMSFVEDVPNNETICQHENPAGVCLLNNFITTDEEESFITLFDFSEESSNLKNRQVKHYGYEFRYGTNDVDLTAPLEQKIPEECDFLWERLRGCGLEIGVPDQLTVNKYLPGQGIPSHVDKHSPFGDTILSLSLGSSVLMDWKHHSGKYVPVEVPVRSLLVMQGEARYDWQHGIQPRVQDPIIHHRTLEGRPVKVITNETIQRGTRISLTFRWTRSGPCQCEYKTLCDSVQKRDIGDDVASQLEELHVHQVYESIASHFSSTRHTPWPKVAEFGARVPAGSVLLDLGCGNGKNILHRNDIFQIGGERSAALLAAVPRAAQRVRLDALHAALTDRCADAILCIAVIHHFSTKARRLQALSTISRLLRPGGRALVTVWAKDQSNSNYLCKSKSQTQEEIMSVGGVNLPVHENRTQFKHNDLLVPWKLRNKQENKLSNKPRSTLFRYYHVFEEYELENLCKEIPSLQVESSFFEEGNWCVICKKI